ncbi:MAG: NUDIX domain-containing protein [Candidatus Saccharibacteria bacterium]|nr:NUDIX domain-containing protein [Candidatus Saccharibacteria bacterium]
MAILESRKKKVIHQASTKPEQRDLYDENRKITGQTITVGDLIPEGKYVLVVMVFIVNSSGHYLIQKRAKERNGLYGTTGGHPKSGQTSLQGIVTEIREEIGIDVNPVDLKLFYSGRSDEEQVFFDDYYLKADIPLSKMKFQKGEVQFATWFMRSEVKGLFKRGKLMANHYEEYLRLQNWLKEQRIARKLIKKEQKQSAKARKKAEKLL